MSADTRAEQGEEPVRPRFRDWPAWLRWSTWAGVGLVLLVLALVVSVFVVANRPLPQTSGTLRVPGLQGEVEVVRDGHGIPQLYAETSRDLFRAQGYVHAQDRFFEMDFRRHVTAGRVSELLGKAGVETDMFIRAMGWRRVAAAEYHLLAPTTKAYLRAYSAGVNAWLRGRSSTELSLEYTVLGLGGLSYKPERWTPVDSLAWMKAMAWDLRGNMDDEIARSRLSVNHTAAQIDELYPGYPYDEHQPIVTGTGRPTAQAAPPPSYPKAAVKALDAVRRGTAAIPELLGTGDGIGSNSWVVSGRHTKSGKPLLANDPHLGVSMPGIWYQMGLHCRTVDEECPFDVSGFSFSGLPGVVIGHNRDIAWGFTNLGPDVTDLYLEKISGKRYLYDGKQVPLAERDEVIRIAGGGTRLITVRSTRHGPLLSDVSADLSSVGANAQVPAHSPERDNGYAVALAWTALTPRPTADAIFMLDAAQDWGDFRQAAARFDVPSQNLVYADRAGNIGYQAPGAIPIRKGGRTGDYPAPGWLPANDWAGTIPFERLPSAFNPPEGFIVTANQAVIGPGYPYHLTSAFDRGYRSQRIRELLEERIASRRKPGVSDMARMQLDSQNPVAATLVPLLLRQLMTSEYYADGQRVLAGWDYEQDADSPAAAYFNAVWSNLLRITFADDLPESLWPDGGQRWMGVVQELLRHPRSQWWDDVHTEGVVEDRDDVLARAMRDARDELTAKLHVSANRWEWGRLHRLELENQSLGQSDIGLVRAVFNRGPWFVGGSGAAVDATSWDASQGYAVTAAPSMRMVVDLADLDRSRWISLSGVSGHVASDHYTDQTDLWAAGRTLAWPFSRKAVLATDAETLLLKPRRSG